MGANMWGVTASVSHYVDTFSNNFCLLNNNIPLSLPNKHSLVLCGVSPNRSTVARKALCFLTGEPADAARTHSRGGSISAPRGLVEMSLMQRDG